MEPVTSTLPAEIRKLRIILGASLIIAGAAAALFISVEARGATPQNRRSPEALVPALVAYAACLLVLILWPKFAAGYVLSTAAITTAIALFVSAFVGFLTFAWGGPNSSYDRLLLNTAAFWALASVILLATAIRFTRRIWRSLPADIFICSCVAPLALSALAHRYLPLLLKRF